MYTYKAIVTIHLIFVSGLFIWVGASAKHCNIIILLFKLHTTFSPQLPSLSERIHALATQHIATLCQDINSKLRCSTASFKCIQFYVLNLVRHSLDDLQEVRNRMCCTLPWCTKDNE